MPLTDSTESTAFDATLGRRSECSLLINLRVLSEERCDEAIGRLGHDTSEIVVQGVLVLVKPSVGTVLDIAGVVLDDKAWAKRVGANLVEPCARPFSAAAAAPAASIAEPSLLVPQVRLSFSVKVRSVALGMIHSSSRHERMPMGVLDSMRSIVG